jgi:hypothetical protein
MGSPDHHCDPARSPGVRVAGDILIRGDAIVLSSPDEYDPGPRGGVHWPVVERARLELVVPVWYVRPDDSVGKRVSSGAADSRAIRGFGVGRNPDAGTVLEAIGRLKDSSNP